MLSCDELRASNQIVASIRSLHAWSTHFADARVSVSISINVAGRVVWSHEDFTYLTDAEGNEMNLSCALRPEFVNRDEPSPE